MLGLTTELPHQDFVENHSRTETASPGLLVKRDADPAEAAATAAAAASTALQSLLRTSMDRGAADYPQTGLPSPYPSTFGDNRSEASSSVDQSSAAHYANSQQDPRAGAYQATATPNSDYAVYPQSARSSNFPDHIQRTYHPASSQSGSSGGGMAQTPTSPSSMPLQDGRHHQNAQQGAKSDSDVPIDPSIAAASPTYPHSQYSPYPPQQDMSHGYAQHSGGLYAQPRPDWTGYGQQHGPPLTPGHHVFPQTPTSAAPQSRQNQVGPRTLVSLRNGQRR
jgi:transcription factor CON7